jgi:hypothetical protein
MGSGISAQPIPSHIGVSSSRWYNLGFSIKGCIVAKVTGILCQIITGDVADAGTDGNVYIRGLTFPSARRISDSLRFISASNPKAHGTTGT